jgi:hypothetical protein
MAAWCHYVYTMLQKNLPRASYVVLCKGRKFELRAKHRRSAIWIYLETEAEPASETSCFLKKILDDGQSKKKKDYVGESYTIVKAL